MKVFVINAIAAICHEANRALCVSIGDNSQPPWSEAPEWQRKSAISGVEFTLANPGAPESANHDNWLADKRADGWKYGPTKNPETKEHPCFVPYEELPPEQQAKDHLFKSIVEGLRPFIASEQNQSIAGTQAPESQAEQTDTVSSGVEQAPPEVQSAGAVANG